MEPKLELLLHAVEGEDGGTYAELDLTLSNRAGTRCTATRVVRIPFPPNFMHPWDWTQMLLCAAADACDTYEGIKMAHGENCPEVPHAGA